MKKKPFHIYEKETGNHPILGTMAHESQLRTQKYLKNGCNSFESKKQVSTPMGFWTEQDILEYIAINNLKIASVYGNLYKENNIYKLSGVQRTGCVFCLYGIQYDSYPNRIQKLEITHPKLYDYCINILDLKNVFNILKIPYRRQKVNKDKYKTETMKICCRIEKYKLDQIKKLYSNLSVTELIDTLIDDYLKIKQFKSIDIKDSKNKYKLETVRISLRVDKNKFEAIKHYLNIFKNTQLIDGMIENKLKSVRQIN